MLRSYWYEYSHLPMNNLFIVLWDYISYWSRKIEWSYGYYLIKPFISHKREATVRLSIHTFVCICISYTFMFCIYPIIYVYRLFVFNINFGVCDY